MNAKRLFRSVTALVLASCALAWDPAQRDCSNVPLCLTSFIWCRDGGCSFPPGACQWSSDANSVNPALLLANKVYKVTWKSDNDLPVRLRWEIGTIPAEPLRREVGRASQQQVRWETNVTGSEFDFNPGEILKSFPSNSSSPPQTSPMEAFGVAASSVGNLLTIDQPAFQKEGETFNRYSDRSSQFTVMAGGVVTYLDFSAAAARQDLNRKWGMGVGIGVGLGVPVIIVLTALGTLVFLKKRMGNEDITHAKHGHEMTN